MGVVIRVVESEMVAIEAGAELDRAVAESIGLKATHKVLGGGYFFIHPGDGVEAIPTEFAPSTDLNAAFFAAESVGLFDVHWLGKLRTGWVVHEMETGPISECQTPALAICAAILAVAET